MKTLYLAEKKEHVADLLNSKSSEHDWMALGPEAAYELEKNGIECMSYSQFLSREELSVVCDKWHNKIKRICEDLDILFAKNNIDIPGQIKPFNFSIFPLIILFDSVVSKISYMKEAFKRVNASEVVIHYGSELSWGAFDLLFTNKDYLWSKLLELEGWDNINKIFVGQRFAGAARGKHNDLLRTVKNMLTRALTKDLFLKKENFLFYEGLFEWQNMLEHFKRSGYGISRYKPSKKDPSAYIEAVPQVDSYYLDNKELFNHCGVDFYPLLAKRLYWIWNVSKRCYPNISAEVNAFIKTKNIKAVLASAGGDIFSGIINMVARMGDIPVIKWQHGFIFSNGRISQFADYKDLMTTSHVFAYGNASRLAYEKNMNGFMSKILCVGSASLDKLRIKSAKNNSESAGVKKILYATTNYYQNNWYCGFDPPFEDMLFYEDQIKLAGWLFKKQQNKETKIQIKLHPSKDYMDPPWASDAAAKGITVIKEGKSFADLINTNDVIIIDSPTTTILQAICTNKPVFIVTRHVVYPEDARKILAKRAVLADTAQELVAVLDDFIETGRYKADLLNDEFLKMYGTYLNDGRSCERALGIIKEEILG